MDFIYILILSLCLSYNGVEAGRGVSKDQQHMILNEHHVNTVLATDDDDFDCVDIYKQPAFQHPLLKNHKIQMYPNLSKESMKERIPTTKKISKFQHHGKGCPPGKVPIQRIKSLNNPAFMSQPRVDNFHLFSEDFPGQYRASIYTASYLKLYHGARALVDIYNPPVQMDQFSMAQIWLQNGQEAPEVNSLQAGWGVHPRIYGDNLTRLTAYWTIDNFRTTGCYNMMCPGFVQVHPSKRLGQAFIKPSIIGGIQYVVDVTISQDQTTGNWWLILENSEKIGYWPKEIFTHLANGASYIEYGGWTFMSPDGISPPMGSGKYPDVNYTEACWFAQIKVINNVYTETDLRDENVDTFVEGNCYKVAYWGYSSKKMGYTFTFGGPGGDIKACGGP